MTDYDRAAAAAEAADHMSRVRAAYRDKVSGCGPSSQVPAHLVAAQWTVGRDADCGVRVATDPFVGGRHAVLSLLTDGSAMVEALPDGLTRTRIVRGRSGAVQPVDGTPVAIERGDTVIVGQSVLPWTR